MAKGRESTAEARSEQDDAPETAEMNVEIGGGGRSDAAASMPDLDFVRGLIEAVDGSGIDSLEITRAGTRVKISKTPPSPGPAPTYVTGGQPQPAAPAPTPAAAPAPTPSTPQVAGEPEPEPAAEEAPSDDGLVEITSPMVGTFYRAPAPDAPPYVEVGSTVSEGQTLCILEAMKLMNELEAEVAGEIREILVENAEPVEYGQPLFRIDPTG